MSFSILHASWLLVLLGVDISHLLGESDGIQVKVAVEQDGAAGEGPCQATSEATEEYVLTCMPNTQTHTDRHTLWVHA